MFLRFYSGSIYSFVLVSIEKIYQLETVFHPISKHLEFRQKHPAATRRILNSLLSVWKSDETLSLVFDILLLITRLLDNGKVQ